MHEVNEELAQAVRQALNSKTKPVGSLGRIEEIAEHIAKIQGTTTPKLAGCTLTIFAGDHGIAHEGVSAYPQAVTAQMVLNFLAGGAASNVFANTLGIPVTVVDTGVAGDPIVDPALVSRRIAPGTANFLTEPAMTAEQLETALQNGRDIGTGSPDTVAAFGEMGIANTASAALVAHRISGMDLDGLVGRGTGLDDDGVTRKTKILADASSRCPGKLDAAGALREFGGFEIATMAGAMLGAAASGRIVLVDGFISTVAAMAAEAIEPDARRSFIFSHKSAERGHVGILEWMGAKPLLALEMRLGEGSGAILAWPLLQASVAMLNDMASFESAGVSGPA